MADSLEKELIKRSALQKATGVGPRPLMARPIDDPFYDLMENVGDPILDILGLSGLENRNPLEIGDPSKAVAAIPPKVAKELGRLMVELMDEGTIKNAFRVAQQKYPRVLGHVGKITSVPEKGSTLFNHRLGSQQRLKNAGGKISEVNIAPHWRNKLFQFDADKSVGHELTHVAQQIAEGPKADTRYLLNNIMYGYYNNPAEVAARKGATKFRRIAKELRKNKPVSPGVSAEIDAFKQTPTPGSMAEFEPVASHEQDLPLEDLLKMQELMKRR